MVTPEKVYWDTAVSDFRNFTKQPGVAFWDDKFVFEPEVKYIAH